MPAAPSEKEFSSLGEISGRPLPLRIKTHHLVMMNFPLVHIGSIFETKYYKGRRGFHSQGGVVHVHESCFYCNVHSRLL